MTTVDVPAIGDPFSVSEVAPVAVHESVLEPPAVVMTFGEAENDAMLGGVA